MNIALFRQSFEMLLIIFNIHLFRTSIYFSTENLLTDAKYTDVLELHPGRRMWKVAVPRHLQGASYQKVQIVNISIQVCWTAPLIGVFQMLSKCGKPISTGSEGQFLPSITLCLFWVNLALPVRSAVKTEGEQKVNSLLSCRHKVAVQNSISLEISVFGYFQFQTWYVKQTKKDV